MRVGKAVQEFETFRLCMCVQNKSVTTKAKRKVQITKCNKAKRAKVEKGEWERKGGRKPDKSNTQHDKVKRICNIKVKLVKKLEESK